MAAWGAVLVLAVPACWHVWNVIRVLSARLPYPIALEWIEEGELYESFRLLHGLPVYGPPEQHFLPYPYPPLHFAVVAVLGGIFGLGYQTGRLVSIAGIAAITVIAVLIATRDAPSPPIRTGLALLVVGAVALGCPVTSGLWDTVRLDTMAMALTLLAALMVANAPKVFTRRRIALVAALLTASMYTKQTAGLFAVWILLFVFARDRRSGTRLGLTTFAICAALLAVLERATRGWFWFWLMHMKGHGISTKLLGLGIARVSWQAPFLGLVPLVVVLLARRKRLSAPCVFWAGMLGTAVVATFLPLLKEGGWVNNFVPLIALAWPVTILLVRALPGPPRALYGAIFASGALVLALARWEPGEFTPTAMQRADALAFARTVRDLRGGVELPIFPFFAVQNGEPVPQIALLSYFDARSAQMTVSPGEAVDASGARWLVLTGYFDEEWVTRTTRSYRFVRELPVGGGALVPDNAGRKSLWERIDASEPPAPARNP